MAETKKAPSKKSPAKAAATPKTTKKAATAQATGGTITVKQIGSPARSPEWAYQTLIGLGLNKMNRVRTLKDTPEVRGMINRVHHLVQIQETK